MSPKSSFKMFSEKTQIMGILNCTPDSFYDGGQHGGASAQIEHGLRMVEEGASWIDVGGESTRPGAEPISLGEELNRVIPVIEGLRQHGNVAISVDTTKSEVARAALQVGASMINDVSGTREDPRIVDVAREGNAYLIIMHSRGNPKTMGFMSHYNEVVTDVSRELRERVDLILQSGLDPSRILLDPGLGFAKTAEQSLEILRCLPLFHQLGFPLVIGASRKSFIAKALHQEADEDRLAGSLGVAFHSAQHGVALLRVHDVQATYDMIRMAEALKTHLH